MEEDNIQNNYSFMKRFKDLFVHPTSFFSIVKNETEIWKPSFFVLTILLPLFIVLSSVTYFILKITAPEWNPYVFNIPLFPVALFVLASLIIIPIVVYLLTIIFTKVKPLFIDIYKTFCYSTIFLFSLNTIILLCADLIGMKVLYFISFNLILLGYSLFLIWKSSSVHNLPLISRILLILLLLSIQFYLIFAELAVQLY